MGSLSSCAAGYGRRLRWEKGINLTYRRPWRAEGFMELLCKGWAFSRLGSFATGTG